MPRELIDTGTDKRFVRRGKKGKFKESDDVGRSLAVIGARRRRSRPRWGKGTGAISGRGRRQRSANDGCFAGEAENKQRAAAAPGSQARPKTRKR
jgi:hypothetical protein